MVLQPKTHETQPQLSSRNGSVILHIIQLVSSAYLHKHWRTYYNIKISHNQDTANKMFKLIKESGEKINEQQEIHPRTQRNYLLDSNFQTILQHSQLQSKKATSTRPAIFITATMQCPEMLRETNGSYILRLRPQQHRHQAFEKGYSMSGHHHREGPAYPFQAMEQRERL